jgi:hypothetical protein
VCPWPTILVAWPPLRLRRGRGGQRGQEQRNGAAASVSHCGPLLGPAACWSRSSRRGQRQGSWWVVATAASPLQPQEAVPPCAALPAARRPSYAPPPALAVHPVASMCPSTSSSCAPVARRAGLAGCWGMETGRGSLWGSLAMLACPAAAAARRAPRVPSSPLRPTPGPAATR